MYCNILIRSIKIRCSRCIRPSHPITSSSRSSECGKDGNDATTLDTFTTTTTAGAVQDYLGIERTAGVSLLAYPLRCYSAFINNYIIDTEIQTEVAQDYDSIYYVNWAKDYFTTARTSPQLGTAVTIQVGTSAPVEAYPYTTETNPNLVKKASDDTLFTGAYPNVRAHTADSALSTDTANDKVYIDPI